MSDSITIARPYAKAIFKHALIANKLSQWSIVLHKLAMAMREAKVANFIANPASTVSQQCELLISIIPHQPAGVTHVENLVKALAYNKRLIVLPDIMSLYETMRSEQEKTLVVKVSAYEDITASQEQQLIDSLSTRLQRQVSLQITIDTTLLGGAVITAGDLVIDGSVRGKLNKLKTALAA